MATKLLKMYRQYLRLGHIVSKSGKNPNFIDKIYIYYWYNVHPCFSKKLSTKGWKLKMAAKSYYPFTTYHTQGTQF